MRDDADRMIAGVRCGRRLLMCGVTASTVASLFELAVPLVVSSAVAALTSGGAAELVTWLPIAVAVVAAGLSAAWRAVVLGRIGAEEMRGLRLAVAGGLTTMSPRSVERFGPGEALAVYSRTVDEIEPLLSAARVRRRTSVVMVVGCVALLFWFDWRLAATLLGALVIGAAVIALVLRPVGSRATEALSALAVTAADLTEHLASIRSATVWGLATPLLRRTERDLDGVATAERRIARAQALVDLTIKITSMTLLIGLGACGAAMIADGTLAVADLVGFLGTLAVLLGPAASYAQAAQQVRSATAARDQLRTVPFEEPRASAPIESAAVSTIRSVRARCGPAVGRQMEPLTFAAERGEMVCLVGPSGSGKTTVLTALAALAPIVSGRVEVDGVDVADRDPAQLWRQIGYVEQSTPTGGTSVRAFLTPDPSNPPQPGVVEELLDDLGLTVRLGVGGLDAVLERGGTSLSGGERQRLAIIRALASDRSLLLLDEPTAHLDSENERRVLDAIDRFRCDRIVIVASHDEEVVRRADRVVRLGE